MKTKKILIIALGILFCFILDTRISAMKPDPGTVILVVENQTGREVIVNVHYYSVGCRIVKQIPDGETRELKLSILLNCEILSCFLVGSVEENRAEEVVLFLSCWSEVLCQVNTYKMRLLGAHGEIKNQVGIKRPFNDQVHVVLQGEGFEDTKMNIVRADGG